MRSRLRSLTGLLIAAGLVPVLAGVLACLPVPIGDPERSQIDPRLTGLWASWEDGWEFMLLEPYDARTWLFTQVGIVLDRGGSCDALGYPDDYEAMIERLEANGACVSTDEVGIYKAWRSQQGGRWFLTLEPKGLINTEEEAASLFDPLVWLVQRIDLQDAEHLTLRLIDEEFDGFDGIPETREAYEEVIGRHAADDDLYGEVWRWVRVRDEHAGHFSALLRRVIHQSF
jgi:hypothetical protein